jgi:hypothetical protein
MRSSAMLACWLAVAGCGDDGLTEHQPAELPMIANFGGPVMTAPQLVPILYSDDPDADTIEAFSRWIVGSAWLGAVAGEYGVGPGSVLEVLRKSEPSPDQIDDVEIVDLLYQGLADGSLPHPASGLGNVLFVVYFPLHTVVTAFGFDKSCIQFGGYHHSVRRDGVELAYAVVPACHEFIRGLTDLEGREYAASHEIVEAITDPIPFNSPGIQLRDPTGTWSGLGLEVADLCTRSDDSGSAREAGFDATRSWSNTAAATGDPCVPVPSDAPYFNVVLERSAIPRIAPGSRESIALTGWATGSTPSWMLSASTGSPTGASVSLGSARMSVGQTTTLAVSVPRSTPSGTTLQLNIYSGLSEASYQMLPMTAIVGAACSTFTTCEECSSHVGCGFCTINGHCEPEGVAGSAESDCPPSAFAHWPGSCGNHCARFISCTDCSSEAGCGWCDSGTPQCVEASLDFGHPAASACPAADWTFTPDYCPS